MSSEIIPFTIERLTGTVGDPEKLWSAIYSYDPPDQGLKDTRGSLHLVIDISSSKPMDLSLAGKLVYDSVTETYYADAPGSPMRILEKAIKNGRDRLVDLAYGPQIKPGTPDIDLNIVAVVVWGSVMYLARMGEVTSVLLRSGAIEAITGGYEGAVTVASGVIRAGDIFIIGSKSFTTAIKKEQLLDYLPSLKEAMSSFKEQNPNLQNAYPRNFSVVLVSFGGQSGDAPVASDSPETLVEIPTTAPPLPEAPAVTLPEVIGKKQKPSWDKLSGLTAKLKPKPSPIYIRQEQSAEMPLTGKKSSKWFLVGMSLLVLLFAGSVVYTIHKKRSKAHSAQVVQLVTEAQGEVAKARDLIDLNNSRAREYLRSAEEMLAEATTMAGEATGDINSLQEDIKVVLDEVNKVVRVVTPTVFYDLQVQSKDIQPTTLTGGSNSLYVGVSEGLIYRLRFTEEDVPQVEKFSGESLQNIYALLPGSGRLFALTGSGVVLVTLADGAQSEVSVTLPVGWEQVRAADVYIDALYFLIPAENQIYRSYITGDEFDEPTAWVGTGAGLADAVSLTIDGDIYVVKSEVGEVLKMTQGSVQEWKIRELDQPLKTPSDIFTTTDSNFLYVADPGNRRLVMIAKEGGLYNRQFVYVGEEANVWTRMQDIWVEEAESTIYLLDNSKIYEISY